MIKNILLGVLCGLVFCSPAAALESPCQVNNSSGARLCDCALLSNRAVVAPASCVQGRIPSSLRVVAPPSGSNQQTKGVGGYIVHERYDPISSGFDVAVLNLSSVFVFDAFVVTPTCFPSSYGSFIDWINNAAGVFLAACGSGEEIVCP